MYLKQEHEGRKIRDFTLSDSFVETFKEKQPNWGPLGYFVYRRTYSRQLENNTQEEFWQTCRRVVEGIYTIQKQHCRTFNLPWSNEKAQFSAQEMFQRIWDFKFLPPGRGLWSMGTEVVYKIGSASLCNCFAYETKIITQKGIKQIGSLVGTSPSLLTKGGKWIMAPIKSFGKQRLWELSLSRQGIIKTIFCTKDHRWFAQDRRTAYRNHGNSEFTTQELRPNIHHLEYVFGQGIKSPQFTPSPFGVAHGFTFGDGGRAKGNRNSGYVTLFGQKDKALEDYFSLCPKHKASDGIKFSSIPNFFYSLPSISENKSYLIGWLMGYFAADGSVDKNGKTSISSTKKENIEFCRDVCSIFGIGTYSIRSEKRVSNLTKKLFTIYSITFMPDTLTSEFFLIYHHKKNFIQTNRINSSKRYWTVRSVKETDREEEVFCATVDGYGAFALEDNILTGNCAFVSTENLHIDFAEPFCFLMDMCMLGCGVGGDTKGAGKIKLIPPNYSNEPFIVEDTREGWVELIRRILNSFIGKNAYPTNIDYSQIRPRGALIKTFGGVASGPDPLKELVRSLTILLTTEEVTTPITTSQIADIFNYIGKCVVSGGVRRTSEILLGEADNEEFLTLKQDKEALLERRWASNISVISTIGMDYSRIAELAAINGEPGLFWIETAKKYGRFYDPPNNRDYRISGSNPCGEIALEDQELCNLVESFPAHHDTLEDYLRTLKFAYLYAKTVTLLPSHNQKTNAVMMRNRRIGCSISGFSQALAKFGRNTLKVWCDQGYKYIDKLDQTYSGWLCIPRSIKMSTVKPSGTVSLLCGATPGVHYPIAEFYIRNIRVQKTSSLIEQCARAGYLIEDDKYSLDTSVISFPVKEKFFLKSRKDLTIWEQFENVAMMQEYWSDNMVSATITFQPHEIKDIISCLETFETRLKSISLMPLENHGYEQAPYISITKEKYEELISQLKPIDFSNSIHETDDKFCDGETCEIKN